MHSKYLKKCINKKEIADRWIGLRAKPGACGSSHLKEGQVKNATKPSWLHKL